MLLCLAIPFQSIAQTGFHGFAALRPLNAIAYGNGVFVAVGPGITLLTSRDGQMWENRSSRINNLYANINFTTEDYSFGGDTVTMVDTYVPASTRLPSKFRSIIFGRGKFVAAGDCGEIRISEDGESWKAPCSSTSEILTGVACGDDGFVIVGDKGTVLTSPDGMIWTQRNSGTDETLFSVAYGMVRLWR